MSHLTIRRELQANDRQEAEEAKATRRVTMARKKKAPELTFQQHIADYLVREHKYGVLEQSDITFILTRFIDQIPAQDRPREKLLARGATVLSDQELLAVMLGIALLDHIIFNRTDYFSFLESGRL